MRWPWQKKEAQAPQRRGFEVAAINRLTAAWLGSTQRIDEELRGDLDRLRARSRHLAMNNDYVRKYLRMVESNIVGPSGIILQSRVMNGPTAPDTLANAAIERAWYDWSQYADITGRRTFVGLCQSVASDCARDGEALVIILRGADNPYGLALQVLDVNRLATDRNQAPTVGANAICMGVEVDSRGRPVAYWIRLDGYTPQRIDARDVLHVYRPDRAEQTRGYPWTHSAMLRLHNLKGYEEAAIINARVGAAKMGIYVSPDGTARELADQEYDGEFYTEAAPGEFGVAPAGYDFKTFDPTYPHDQFADFVKSHLRGIATGLGVAYNSLSNDLEGVNYSSIRAGVLEERDQWVALQDWFIDAFMEPIFAEWLPLALLNQAITMPNGSPLPIGKIDKFRAHEWQGRRWSWVDPTKDIEAARLSIQTGISSPQQIAAQSGQDIEDVLDAIAAFEAMVAAKKVKMIDLIPDQAQPIVGAE